jgi:hypothetical protein
MLLFLVRKFIIYAVYAACVGRLPGYWHHLLKEIREMFLQEKAVEPPSKKGKGGKTPAGLSPRNRKARRSIGTALLQSVAQIGTQNTMKSSRKT